MEKNYEAALSYAHDDYAVARVLGNELRNVFADQFFMDEFHPEDLAKADSFEETLQNIFQKANTVIILYSENYREGKFTLVELKAILERANCEKEFQWFIININDCDTSKIFLGDKTYMPLTIKADNEEWIVDRDVRRQIYDNVHKRIKGNVIERSIEKRKDAEKYSLNIHTTFAPGNPGKWKKDYDWNLLAAAYVKEDSRKLKRGASWKKLWDYVENEFLCIKENLEPDIKRRIHLNCHLSIAYKLGQIYGDLEQGSGNRNLELLSSHGKISFDFAPDQEVHSDLEIEDFCEEIEGNNSESKDLICIISIKKTGQQDILETVKEFLKKQGQEYRKICLFKKKMSIEDTESLEKMAVYLRERINTCREESGLISGYTIHIFPDTLAALMFVLGARAIVSGKIKLYEYDMDENSYEMSLTK